MNENYRNQLIDMLISKGLIEKYEIYEALLINIINSAIQEKFYFSVLEGLIDATKYKLEADNFLGVKPVGIDYRYNISYLLACAVTDTLSADYSNFIACNDKTVHIRRATEKSINNMLDILRNGVSKHTKLPNSDWLKFIKKCKKDELQESNSLWWDIIDHSEIFQGLDNDVLENYFSELWNEEYKLGWCDNDKDIGIHDNPDIIVVRETIKYIKTIINKIPKEKRNIVFNFIINAASCGRGLDTNNSMHIERMKYRINNCFHSCINNSFNVKLINENCKNYWNKEIS